MAEDNTTTAGGPPAGGKKVRAPKEYKVRINLFVDEEGNFHFTAKPGPGLYRVTPTK